MKLFRGTLNVEFDADAVADRFELGSQIEKLLNAGVQQFKALGANVSVGVTAGFVNVRPKRQAANDQRAGDDGKGLTSPKQIDPEEAIAGAPVRAQEPPKPPADPMEIPENLRRAPLEAQAA